MIPSRPACAAPSGLKRFVTQPYLGLAYDFISSRCCINVQIGGGSSYTAELCSIQLRVGENNCIFQRSTYSSGTVVLPPVKHNVV